MCFFDWSQKVCVRVWLFLYTNMLHPPPKKKKSVKELSWLAPQPPPPHLVAFAKITSHHQAQAMFLEVMAQAANITVAK